MTKIDYIPHLLAALTTWWITMPHVQAQQPWNTPATYPKREIRAVWVTTLSGLDWPKSKATSEAGREQQKQELCRLLDQLQAANINTVLLQTRIRGSVIYPSAIEPWDISLTGQFDRHPGYDPLAFAIEETHKRGMELHAWVVTIPAFKTEVARRMGRKSLLATHPQLLRKHLDSYYLDPALPGTADYLTRICLEITANYDIDGLHFDYIRYPEEANTFPDGPSFNKYGKGQRKADWRRDNVTRIVRQIHREVKRLKPWVKMSSSPVGKYRDTRRYSARGWNSYDAVFQDAQGWLREGIQDALYPMMYFTGNHFYPFALDWQEGSHGRPVVPGLGIYFLHPAEKNWDFSVIGRELYYVRDQGLSGQAYFRSQFLTDDVKGIYKFLRSTFYAYPALPAAYPWIDSEAPSAPTQPQRQDEGNQRVALSWQPSTDNLPQAGVRYNVYASPDYPVDVNRAENLVAVNLSEPRYLYNKVWGMNLAVTAIDRCGNESQPLQVGGGTCQIARDTSTDASLAPGEHYLPHNGQGLSLPFIPDVDFYLITDLAGNTLRTGPWAGRIDISRLPRGLYRLRTLQKRGISRLVGEFKK